MIRLGLDSDLDYYDFLKSHPDEVYHFLDGFTINYSYFFRNPEVFHALLKMIISCLTLNRIDKPDMKHLSIYEKIRQNKKLKIWSCPCATGEEPYSIAMLFDQIKEKYGKFPEYLINASDIDKSALKKAKIGSYNSESLTDMEENFRSYFKERSNNKIAKKFVISEEIKKKIDFFEEDVIKGHQRTLKYDIIFCRYLFIYINRNYREKLIEVLERHLEKGGLLIIGKTESLFYSKTRLSLYDKNARIYVMN